VQQAWLDEDVAACGFCQAGQIMAASALLADKPHPTDADIDAIDNVCRCGTYNRIRKAIKRAAALPDPEGGSHGSRSREICSCWSRSNAPWIMVGERGPTGRRDDSP
jgi:xanthine dehydrogenase iron-sulfur cluster and FAD-binding subunit A